MAAEVDVVPASALLLDVAAPVHGQLGKGIALLAAHEKPCEEGPLMLSEHVHR